MKLLATGIIGSRTTLITDKAMSAPRIKEEVPQSFTEIDLDNIFIVTQQCVVQFFHGIEAALHAGLVKSI